MSVEAKKNIGFRARDGELREKWTKEDDLIQVDDDKFDLETKGREEAFLEAQFTTAEERRQYERYRSEWYRRPMEHDPGEQPLSVMLDLVSTCNLACPMCYTITDSFQNSIIGAQRQIPWTVVRSIIDEAAELGVPSMHFSWRGESTLYRDRDEAGNEVRLPDVLAYARKRGILGIMVFTNGQLIDREMARRIVDADPSVIVVSVDGLHETYNKMRAPKKKPSPDYDPFATVIAAIGYLLEARNAKGRSRPQIRVNAVYPAIAEDPEGYYEYMRGIGAELISVLSVSDYREVPLDDDKVNRNWSCQFPFQRLTISANGVILPCTGAFREEEGLVLGRYAGTPDKILHRPDGSKVDMELLEMTLKEAWNCEKIRKIRLAHAENRRYAIRPGCRDCRRGSVDSGKMKFPDGWDDEIKDWQTDRHLADRDGKKSHSTD